MLLRGQSSSELGAFGFRISWDSICTSPCKHLLTEPGGMVLLAATWPRRHLPRPGRSPVFLSPRSLASFAGAGQARAVCYLNPSSGRISIPGGQDLGDAVSGRGGNGISSSSAEGPSWGTWTRGSPRGAASPAAGPPPPPHHVTPRRGQRSLRPGRSEAARDPACHPACHPAPRGAGSPAWPTPGGP